MSATFCLDPAHSTTRLVTRSQPVTVSGTGAKLTRVLFLPSLTERQGEGGLRVAGYFKPTDPGHAAPGGRGADLGEAPPLITVITVAFNAAQTLERAILSVIGQSYSNVEYIVIDGGSTDGSLEILHKYDCAIDYWVSEPDAGIYEAWNKGVRLACGDWLAFLGADDLYLADAIDSYARAIVDHPDRDLQYVSSRVNLTRQATVMRTIGQPWRWKSFRTYMNVAHVGSLHSRSLFEKYGLYDTAYKSSGDYELLLRPRAGLRAAYLNSVTANMDIGGTSDNSTVLQETEKAKITSGGRNPLMSRIERILAVGKLKLRKWLWC